MLESEKTKHQHPYQPPNDTKWEKESCNSSPSHAAAVAMGCGWCGET